MAKFALIEPMKVTLDKSEYVVGDKIKMTVSSKVKAWDINPGNRWEVVHEVWQGSVMLDRNRTVHVQNFGSDDVVGHDDFEFGPVEMPGVFSGEVRVHAHNLFL